MPSVITTHASSVVMVTITSMAVSMPTLARLSSNAMLSPWSTLPSLSPVMSTVVLPLLNT